MPQYSNSQTTEGGSVVLGVLDTESSTITFTVTTPKGLSSSVTIPATQENITIDNNNEIRRPLRAGFSSTGETEATITGFGSLLRSVKENVTEQAAKAGVEATATNTNVPQNPNPPTPVANNTNPQINEPTTPPAVTSTSTTVPTSDTAVIVGAPLAPREQPAIDPATDPNTNVGGTQEIVPVDQNLIDANQDPQTVSDLEALERQIANEPLTEPPGVPVDEFGGVDQAIISNQNSLQEPPQLTEEEADQALRQFNQEFIENEEPSNIDVNSDAALGQLGINTDLPTEGSLGELGLNTDNNLSGQVISARGQAGLQYGTNFSSSKDWRVRLKLAPGSNYLYNAPASERGILAPLNATKGVIFPYTPSVSVSYSANYDPSTVTHSNYKILQYQNSSVDNLQLTCDFTAQDTNEANYLLAVIHFFRSVTKMFYGQDQNPKRGTPPPLCYLEGFGEFQFDMHPLVVTNFTYGLPNDVDYIKAMPVTGAPGQNLSSSGQGSTPNVRLQGTGVTQGGINPGANFSTPPTGQSGSPTYVPTKIQLQITCMPVVSRKDISDKFSLKEYGKGTLLQGSKRNSGGIW